MPALRIELDPSREEAELRGYLGERYDHRLLQRWERTLEQEVIEHQGSEKDFYRSSKAYLYNLTAFAMSRTKLPYLEELVRHLPPGGRVLDYGCGIGSDGLALLEAGYRVEFADFDNPSVAFLRWRLSQRGLSAPIHDLDRGVPSDFDGAFAFDVIEHVEDPLAFLAELEARARLVVVNFLEPLAGESELHHELPIASLVDRASRQRLLSYTIHHRRSHLVAYSPQRAGAPARLRARVLVVARRLAERAKRPLRRR